MNLKLRPIEAAAEADAFAPLLERGVRESVQAFQETDEDEGGWAAFAARHFERPETLLVVAEAEGEPEPLAFCLTGPYEDPWSGRAWPLVLGLWVRPNIRHRGVARALVQEASRLLAQRGVHLIAARTGHNDDAVLSMGERWGFIRAWEFLEREG